MLTLFGNDLQVTRVKYTYDPNTEHLYRHRAKHLLSKKQAIGFSKLKGVPLDNLYYIVRKSKNEKFRKFVEDLVRCSPFILQDSSFLQFGTQHLLNLLWHAWLAEEKFGEVAKDRVCRKYGITERKDQWFKNILTSWEREFGVRNFPFPHEKILYYGFKGLRLESEWFPVCRASWTPFVLKCVKFLVDGDFTKLSKEEVISYLAYQRSQEEPNTVCDSVSSSNAPQASLVSEKGIEENENVSG